MGIQEVPQPGGQVAIKMGHQTSRLFLPPIHTRKSLLFLQSLISHPISNSRCWESLFNRCTWYGRFPDSETAVVRVCTGGGAQAMKSFHPLIFLSFMSSLVSLLPVDKFPQEFPFYQLNTINYDLRLRLIQTLCLRYNYLTPPSKNPHRRSLPPHQLL